MVLRTTLATAALVSAAVHLFMWFDYARDDDVLGPGFMLNALGGATVAVLVLAWRHWIPALLGAGFGLSTLGAFCLATTVGFLGTTATWQGWEVWSAAAAEVVAIVTGALLLREDAPRRSRVELEHHAPVRGAHLH
jgi:hypothetical protein